MRGWILNSIRIIMSTKTLEQRYDLFSQDVEELLRDAGHKGDNLKPTITGKALYKTLVILASIHFPEDADFGSIGPRGLISGMYKLFDQKYANDQMAYFALSAIVKYIIKYRPPLDLGGFGWKTNRNNPSSA